MTNKTTVVSAVKAVLEAYRAQAALLDKLMLEVIKALQAGGK
jgi:hypothetical protein